MVPFLTKNKNKIKAPALTSHVRMFQFLWPVFFFLGGGGALQWAFGGKFSIDMQSYAPNQ
jgi:hypothetical protein